MYVTIWIYGQKQYGEPIYDGKNDIIEYNSVMNLEYQIIYSNRKSIALQINPSGKLIVRSPHGINIKLIESFIQEKKSWIKKQQQKLIPRKIPPKLSKEEIEIAKQRLYEYIVPRIQELYDGKNLPKITNIKITKSERRWGSCSFKNGLCFSYRLNEYINTPFLDAIILHELAHLKEKNHQKPFWDLVYSWMPEYEAIIKQY